jgi:hypothetical protein
MKELLLVSWFIMINMEMLGVNCKWKIIHVDKLSHQNTKDGTMI